MKRRLTLLFSVMAIVWAPAMACAQQSGAFGLSGLPSLPSFGMFGGSSKCGETCPPSFAPTIYFGWGVPEDNGSSVSLDASTIGVSNLLASTTRTKNASNGFWLGTALPIALGNNLSFLGTGWYLFSGATSAVQDRRTSNRGLLHGQWDSKVDHWFVDGAFAYGWSGFSALAGVRYDYNTSQRTSPDADLSYNGQERIDSTFKSVIPFIGFQSVYRDTTQNLSVRIIGLPVIFGSVTIGSTANASRSVYDNVPYSGGDFYEIFAEYSRKFFGASQAGVFARWNTIRATSTGAYNRHSSAGVVTSDDYNVARNASSWTIGGLVTLDFNTPL